MHNNFKQRNRLEIIKIKAVGLIVAKAAIDDLKGNWQNQQIL